MVKQEIRIFDRLSVLLTIAAKSIPRVNNHVPIPKERAAFSRAVVLLCLLGKSNQVIGNPIMKMAARLRHSRSAVISGFMVASPGLLDSRSE